MRRFLLAKDPAAGAVTVRATAGPGGAGTRVQRGDEGTEPLDLTDMPRFSPPAASLAALVGRALPGLALLVAATLGAFGVAAGAVARYDAR
jgi:hypothetical protein